MELNLPITKKLDGQVPIPDFNLEQDTSFVSRVNPIEVAERKTSSALLAAAQICTWSKSVAIVPAVRKGGNLV